MRYHVLSAAVIVFAFWYAHRHRQADEWRHGVAYHLVRWHHERCHAAPTRLHRTRLALVRVTQVRIRITFGSNARTA